MSGANALVNGPSEHPATVSVEGPDSTWDLSFADGKSLRINNATVTVSDGGTIHTQGRIELGDLVDTAAELHVLGSGSTVTADRPIIVGYGGSGLIEVKGAGALLESLGRGAFDPASPEEPYDHVGMEIGRTTEGRLEITEGGNATCNYILSVGSLNDPTSGNGTILVDGDGSKLTANYQLEIGRTGTGEVTVTNGGLLKMTAEMNNSVDPDVSDGSTGLTFVGLNGDGSLNVTDGGSFQSVRQMQIGVRAGSNGMMVVSGGGVVECAKGLSGSGTSGLLGVYVDSLGQVEVTGDGSLWTEDGGLNVGWYGTGSLSVKNGGRVESQKGVVARLNGSHGSVTIGGSGATWNITEELHIGGTPFDATTVSNDASVFLEEGGILQVGTNINIWNGGLLSMVSDDNLGSLPDAFQANYLYLDHGTLRAMESFSLAANRGMTLSEAGGIFDVAAEKIMVLEGEVTGSGDLIKNGEGTLVLAAMPTYLGNTNIAQGLLQIMARTADLHDVVGGGSLLVGSDESSSVVTVAGLDCGPITVLSGSGLIIGTPYPSGDAPISPAPAPVPEPATGLLVLVMMAGGAFAWKKRQEWR